MGELLALEGGEAEISKTGAEHLRQLALTDDWLPEEYTQNDGDTYRQYLLHCDSRERFSVVSFVWRPGQSTPIHDHTVWALVAVLRGAELSQRYSRANDRLTCDGPPRRLTRGDVEFLSPAAGDIHKVANDWTDCTVSIHVYGGNIGRIERSSFDTDGIPRPFVSGYSNEFLPNIWRDVAAGKRRREER
jgi:predicted metal-dependent enzyme (double-stranded beta helix superfamily)